MIALELFTLIVAFVLLVIAGWLQPLELWKKLLCWGLASFVLAHIAPVAAQLK
jgi:hypothetical protein